MSSSMAKGLHHSRTNGHGRASRLPLLVALAALAAAGSLASVRLTNPYSLDDLTAIIVLFVALPLLLVVVAGLIHRWAGVAAAILLPAAWLFVNINSDDPFALWLVPLAVAAAAIVVSRTSVLPRWRAACLAAVLLVVGVVVAPPPGAPGDGTAAVLIGVDGASWQCVDMAVEAGRMPVFEELMAEGHRAKLRSLVPSMLSPQVWSAIATGCGPAVNGVYGWSASQSTFQVGRFWDRMWLDGRSVGTCGWYFTWPPPDVIGDNDFVVPSTLAPDSSCVPDHCGFFWEVWATESGRQVSSMSYLRATIGALRGGVRLSTIRRALALRLGDYEADPLGLEGAWRKRRISAAIQSDMFAELLRTRRPELGVVMFNQVDKVSHLYWKYRDPGSFSDVTPEEAERYGLAIQELYAEADRVIGKIREVIRPDAHVVIVSDHGFRPALRKIMGEFCRIRTENLLEALGVGDDVLGSNLGQRIFLETTTTREEAAEARLAQLENALSAVHLEGEDEPFLDVWRDGAMLMAEIRPRNAVPEDARVVVGDESYPFGQLVSARVEAMFSGEHAPDGVYLYAGPMVGSSTPTDSLSVVDIAPTMAAILDLPFSEQWEGHAAFRPDALGDVRMGDYPPPAAFAEAGGAATTDQLKEKLRSLGYLE